MIKKYQDRRIKRHLRLRGKITGSTTRPRLAVFRSDEHIYAQVIDDGSGKTLASANDLEVKDKVTKTEKAKLVGQKIADVAKKAKVKKVVFDRGGFLYHGRVKALAEAAREKGLEF
jgi:large subunit ribosomal protein L18